MRHAVASSACSLLIGYFEGIDSEWGIAWRSADSLGLRSFLGVELDEMPPDHSTISCTRRLIDVGTLRTVFCWGGEIDLICSAATITDELRRKFDLASLTSDVALGIVSAKDSTWNGVEDLRGRRIAVRVGHVSRRACSAVLRPRALRCLRDE